MTTSHEHTAVDGDGVSEQHRLRKLGELFDLRGLGVVVAGGGSGLGLRMGTALAEAGAHVTLLDIVAERLYRAARSWPTATCGSMPRLPTSPISSSSTSFSAGLSTVRTACTRFSPTPASAPGLGRA